MNLAYIANWIYTRQAPTFFTAGIYVILGCYINVLGRQSSILSPKMYLWIFCTCDVISLVVQAIGGGMTASQSSKVNGDTSTGTNIMVAGIAFQLASITIFVTCAADFVRRCLREDRHLLQGFDLRPALVLFSATTFSLVLIYIRCIYRTIELAEGWNGYVISNERYFIALDGAMMAPAVIIFNFFHPGWLLPVDVTNEKVAPYSNKNGTGDSVVEIGDRVGKPA